MIPEPLQLDPTTERVAVNLLRHLEWQSRGFSLIPFADVGPALSLASWLDQRLVSMGRPLQRWDAPANFVKCPHNFVDEILENLPTENPSQSALWVWLHASLANLGSLHGVQDDSLLREAEQIYEMLTKTCPSVVDYSQRLDHVRRLLQK